MIEEQARVVRVQGDIAEVIAERQSACNSCSVRGGCGTSLLAEWFPRRRLTFQLRNDIGAGLGDAVIVGLDERLLQRGALLLYATPLGGLLLGAVLGERLAPHIGLPAELGAVLTGLLGLTAALLLVRHVSLGRHLGGQQGVRLLRLAPPQNVIVPGTRGLTRAPQQQGFREYE